VGVPHTPQWWRDAAGAFTWLTMLFVVALWVRGGGIQELHSLAGGLTTLGRLTGMVSAQLLLVQVLLMARIPLVERSYGQDELARRHRLVGLWSFNLMWAHPGHPAHRPHHPLHVSRRLGLARQLVDHRAVAADLRPSAPTRPRR